MNAQNIKHERNILMKAKVAKVVRVKTGNWRPFRTTDMTDVLWKAILLLHRFPSDDMDGVEQSHCLGPQLFGKGGARFGGYGRGWIQEQADKLKMSGKNPFVMDAREWDVRILRAIDYYIGRISRDHKGFCDDVQYKICYGPFGCGAGDAFQKVSTVDWRCAVAGIQVEDVLMMIGTCPISSNATLYGGIQLAGDWMREGRLSSSDRKKVMRFLKRAVGELRKRRSAVVKMEEPDVDLTEFDEWLEAREREMLEFAVGAQSSSSGAKWFAPTAFKGSRSKEAESLIKTALREWEAAETHDAEFAAVVKIEKAAVMGNAKAQCCMGEILEEGRVVDQNDMEALRWYRKAAENGDVHAQARLGLRYQNGKGVEKDESKAAEWMKKAAEGGCAEGQRMLGRYYALGIGVKQDYAEARRWFDKAVAHNDGYAMYYIGFMYENGHGVERDINAALDWYGRAAWHGVPDAQNRMYEIRLERMKGSKDKQ